ncbi:MAG: penicillin-binding protein 2, partial [bacterium]|nr:penicillin-binding protein 2 [bacterium]
MHDDFMHNGTRERRAYVLFGAVMLLFGVLGLRLYSLQISGWEQYRNQSEKNTMQPVPIEAGRGLIRDRNGVILVDNRPSYAISVVPPRLLSSAEGAEREGIVTRLSQIVGLPDAKIEEKLTSKNRHFYEPVKLKIDVGFETVSIIEENRYDLPGVEVQVESRRGYPTFSGEHPLAPHILGYVGLIDVSQYPQMKSQGYRYGDQIGKRGIERLQEARMRGQEGVKYIEVNARGREVGSFPEKTLPPIPGKDIMLTLDWRLQQAAEQAFAEGQKGSLIAMEPATGKILAMVSQPQFHPRSIRDMSAWRALQSDPEKPLLNRSMQGEYPPASVFKMITAIAALDLGILGPDEYRFDPCEGEYVFGDRLFRCHKTGGCGELTLRDALVQSWDAFFYRLGREVGIENWNHYARLFGFGQTSQIDIAADGEANGLVPDRNYYKKRNGKWYDGNMLNLAIGQGELLATPLQVARYTAALASGVLVNPHVFATTNTEVTRLPIKDSTFEAIRSMMQDVVGRPHGTGRHARLPGIDVAGKTGTGQNPHGNDHAWFVAFAPVENPRIAITVLVENGGAGSLVAAPIARKVLGAFFELDSAQPIPDLASAQKLP